jgi:hypothetical protein
MKADNADLRQRIVEVADLVMQKAETKKPDISGRRRSAGK